uniref:AF4/FMR2 family member lilli n=1 Tax=Heterorhabditis bacteriophora TaxID=37862 RepID=A0A1I7XQ16_HETBA
MRGAVRLATSLPSYASFQICSFMAEDPEGIRRRVDQQQLRRQLHEVFGPFDQFAEYVSGSGSSGPSAMMRHGVVQIPTTPVVSSRSRLPVGGSSSPINQQSTQQLLQSMQNLVTSPPIQPIQLCTPFALKKDYLNTEPSSSTRSVVDGNDNYNKKKRKNRTVNSDSETDRERDKRKRTRDCSNDHDNAANASTSRGRRNTEDERLRALFGEDGDEDRKEPPDKPVSPDSGVHSTENDPGDENDMSAQNILSMITKLSPPLSPIRLRPKDKKSERETREKENREKEERSRKDLERREKEQREREAAERKEQERKDKEEREKKEREIANVKRKKERKKSVKRMIDEKKTKKKKRKKNDDEQKRNEKRLVYVHFKLVYIISFCSFRRKSLNSLTDFIVVLFQDGNEKDLEKKEIRREKERKEDKEKKKEKRDREKRRESETDFAKKGIHQEMAR